MWLQNTPNWFHALLLSTALILLSLSNSFADQVAHPRLPNQAALRSDALVKQFIKHVAGGDFDKADTLVDFAAYADRVSKLVFDTTRQQQSFARGFVTGLQQESFTERVFVAATVEATTFMPLGVDENGLQIVRLNYESGGLEYIKFIVGRGPEGRLRIRDFKFASTGEYSSVGTATAVKYLIKPSDSILRRLFGGIEPNEALLADFKKLGVLRAQGKNRQAYELIQTFPDALLNEKEWILMSTTLASLFDEVVYRAELSKLEQRYGDDPKLAFMLIDHYFYQEDWVGALKAVQVSIQEWADDGDLNTILADLLLRNGQDSAAIEASLRAIKLEPTNEESHWGALELYNSVARFNDAVDILTKLQDQFSYRFTADEFQKNPQYSEFVKSSAFQNWAEQ